VKVLLLHDYAGFDGGAEVMTYRIRDGLRRRGHDARLLASRAGTQESSGADYTCFGTVTPRRVLAQTCNPDAVLQLHRVLRSFQPDVVHVRIFLTQLSPAILPLLRNVPSLYHVVWYEPICPMGTRYLPDGRLCGHRAGWACLREGCVQPRHWPARMVQMALFGQLKDVFRRTVANSHFVRRRLADGGFDVDHVLWNGTEERPARAPLEDRREIVFAGRLVPEKGVDVLLDAFTRVAPQFPDARLTIAGTGPALGTLQQAAEGSGLGDRIRFRGQVPREQMDALTAGAWVQVVPSRWQEPFGLVAPEAMMRGVAVVASRSGGLEEVVVDGQTGFLCEPGDAASLAEGLRRVLGNRDLAEALGQAGRARALAEFHVDRFLDRLCSLYDETIGARDSQPGIRSGRLAASSGAPAGRSTCRGSPTPAPLP